MKLKYAVVIEKAPNNYCAYVPDAPVCLVTAAARDEILVLIREAIEINIETAMEFGEPIPEPRMSLRDAMRHHLSALDESDDAFYAEHGIEPEDWEDEETSFIMVEVEVEPARSVSAAEPAVAVAASGSV